MQTLTVTPAAARSFLIRSFGLTGWQSLPDPAAALQQLAFVQEDSINICGRIHDLILWPRVAGYAPEHLAEALYGPAASAFEIHFPNLAVLPRTDYPYFVARMRERQSAPGRWQGLFPEEEPVAAAFLAAVDARGPLSTRSHGNDFGHMVSAWGTRATVASQVVEKLWLHGTLSIAYRKNFERYFDRTERVAPDLAAWHADTATLPDPSETARFRAHKRLRARRLFRPRRDELALLGESAFCKVEIHGVRRPWYCLAEDSPSLAEGAGGCETLAEGAGGCETLAEGAGGCNTLFLLAPLDPLVYDRERTRDLFGFDYTWEVYTPEAKRRWGYYVLPILQGDRLIGRVDPRMDRKQQCLELLSVTLEPGVEAAAVAPALAARLQAFARFLGASQVVYHDVPRELVHHQNG